MTDIQSQLYQHFCESTDGGVQVHFTSKTLLNEDGTGVTLDEFIDTALTAERERLVSAIKIKSDSKEHQTNEQYLAYEEAVDDILTLINPPSNRI